MADWCDHEYEGQAGCVCPIVPRSVLLNLRELIAGGDPRDREGALGIIDGILARAGRVVS